MNPPIRFRTALLIALLPLASLHAAFDPSVVPADARWVVALDLKALRDSPLGKDLIEAISPLNPKSAAVDAQIDLSKLVAAAGSLTAYGTEFSRNPKEMDGVLLCQGSADFRKLAEGLVAAATVAEPQKIIALKDLPFDAYSIKGEVIVGFPPEPIVLLSRSKPRLIAALELFRNRHASLPGTASPVLTLLPKEGKAVLVAASVVPSAQILGIQNSDTRPETRILQMADAASLVFAIDEQNTTADLMLQASSAETADKLQKILQGLVAVASLAETNDQQLAKFLQSANTTLDARKVALHLSYPTEGVVRLVKNLRAQGSTRRGTPSDRASSPARLDQRESFEKPYTLIARWTADGTGGAPVPTVEGLATRTIDNVALKNGMLLSLLGRRHEGENARIDAVEIVPVGGGTGLTFEAEQMNLSGYQVENAAFASRGRIVMLTASSGRAEFGFPGADGTYTIKVRYIDESDGKSTFTLITKDPEPPTGPQ